MPAISLISLMITAGVLALVLLWPRVRSGPSGARLAVEAFVTTVTLAVLIYRLIVIAQRLPW
jgi:hypothetical protein